MVCGSKDGEEEGVRMREIGWTLGGGVAVGPFCDEILPLCATRQSPRLTRSLTHARRDRRLDRRCATGDSMVGRTSLCS